MPSRVKQPYAAEPRKLPSSRWKGCVVRYERDTGKRHEITQTFDTKEEAKNLTEKEAARYRDDPNRKPPSEQTLTEYLNHWLIIKRTLNFTDKTLTSYREMAARSVRELGGTSLGCPAFMQNTAIRSLWVNFADVSRSFADIRAAFTSCAGSWAVPGQAPAPR